MITWYVPCISICMCHVRDAKKYKRQKKQEQYNKRRSSHLFCTCTNSTSLSFLSLSLSLSSSYHSPRVSLALFLGQLNFYLYSLELIFASRFICKAIRAYVYMNAITRVSALMRYYIQLLWRSTIRNLVYVIEW